MLIPTTIADLQATDAVQPCVVVRLRQFVGVFLVEPVEKTVPFPYTTTFQIRPPSLVVVVVIEHIRFLGSMAVPALHPVGSDLLTVTPQGPAVFRCSPQHTGERALLFSEPPYSLSRDLFNTSFKDCRLTVVCSQHSLPLEADLSLREIDFQAAKFRGKAILLDPDEVQRQIAPFAARLIGALEARGGMAVVKIVDVLRPSLLHEREVSIALIVMIVFVPYPGVREYHSVLSLVTIKC